MLRPTSGTATIYGKDIRTDMDTIRLSLGMCPQHNILFHKYVDKMTRVNICQTVTVKHPLLCPPAVSMTVAEHIMFYSLLKSCPAAEAEDEVENMLQDLGLPHKRHELTQNLSGLSAGWTRWHSYSIILTNGLTSDLSRWHAEEAVSGCGLCGWGEGGDPG